MPRADSHIRLPGRLGREYAVLVRTVQQCDAILDATDTSGDPAGALARLVASSWQLVHQFRNILLARSVNSRPSASAASTTGSCAACSP